MKILLTEARRSAQAFAESPLFDHLRDADRAPRDRLAVLAAVLPLAAVLDELERHVLCLEPAYDPLQRLVNRHAREDDARWRWAGEDLVALGLAASAATGEPVRPSIGLDATGAARLLGMRLAQIAAPAAPAARLAIVAALDAAVDLLFEQLASLAAEAAAAGSVGSGGLQLTRRAPADGGSVRVALRDAAGLSSLGMRRLEPKARGLALEPATQAVARLVDWSQALVAAAARRGASTGSPWRDEARSDSPWRAESRPDSPWRAEVQTGGMPRMA